MSLSPLLPRVAVVVPVFNRAYCILATLDSILAQTLRPAQVIVVDNGSTDQSKVVVEAWMQQQKPHCELLLLSEPCRGASAARNRGLQAVTTEWVSFFDSDDLMSPDFLEQMLGCAQAQEKEWVIARTQMVFAPNTSASFPKRIVRWGTSQPTLVDHILGACISTQSFVAQTPLLRRIKGWNEHLPMWNDYEIGLRLLLTSPQPAWCEGVFHQIFQHPDSITGSCLSDRTEQLTLALVSIARTLQEHSDRFSVPPLRHAFTALLYRTNIVAGQLLCEGNPRAAQQLLRVMGSQLPQCPKRHSLFSSLLRHYVRWGGRGAWRIARLLARC